MFFELFPDYAKESLKEWGRFLTYRSVRGGDVNEAYELEFEKGALFLKTNASEALPGLFPKEAAGLKRLAAAGGLAIPEVVLVDELEGQEFLVLEWIQTGLKPKHYWLDFAAGLAQIHRQSKPFFGLEEDNYIATLNQSNQAHSNWADFWANQRIEPLFARARDQGYFGKEASAMISRYLHLTEELIPEEPPSLLHGDLWGGNHLVGANGKAYLIDPAIYYGHREVDLAMMQLFGGFPHEAFEAYQQLFPLEPGWSKRLAFHQVYPLLVHVNLFGTAYASQTLSVIRRFI
jgi:fructosamine-3-kinase